MIPIFVYSSLYRNLNLTFRCDIGGLPRDYTIKIEMETGSMGQADVVLSLDMFNTVEQL